MKHIPLLTGLFLLCGLTAGLALPPAAPIPFPAAVKESDVDFAACRVIVSGSEQTPLDADTLKGVLGFADRSPNQPVIKGYDRAEIKYLIVFKQPVAIGTLLGSIGDIKFLKPDAPLPPNATNADDWQMLDVAPNQSAPRLVPLPPGATVRALILSTPILRTGPADLRFLTSRLANLTPAGTANAQA